MAHTTLATCPQCRSPIPASAPDGACPSCLLNLAFSPDLTTPTQTSRFPAPSPESLQTHFQDLEIQQLLGQGGMGVVYRARQSKLDRCVALKILAPSRARDPIFEERFLREARTLARLSHPHIVSVFDVGRAGEYCYILMEFVDGASLRALIRDGALSADEAVRLVPQICDAMQYTHDHGVVHRDIKPENVLVDQLGQVKIADFGIAKLMGDSGREDANLTVDGLRLGTTGYMAPEQALAKAEVDHRADIYSLGIMFYEMLTGKLPTPSYTPPSRIRELDTRLDRVVERSLRDAPEERFQQANELKQALEQIATTKSVVERMRVVIGLLAVCLAVVVAFGLWSIYGDHSSNDAGKNVADVKAPTKVSDSPAETTPVRRKLPFTPTEAEQAQQQWAAYLRQPVELTDSVGQRLRLVPPGEQEIEPGYDVVLSRAFYLGRTEVTVGEFRKFVEATNYVTHAESSGLGGFVHVVALTTEVEQKPEHVWKNKRFADDDQRPVGQVTIVDMERYCQWLSEKEGCTYRLPTEAEWYWAARAGLSATNLFGESDQAAYEIAWLGEISENRSHVVGGKRPNAWGFCDMLGNMCEMCSDGYDDAFPKGKFENPTRPATQARRIGLGSSFADPPTFMRLNLNENMPFHSIGFRVVREIPAKP